MNGAVIVGSIIAMRSVTLLMIAVTFAFWQTTISSSDEQIRAVCEQIDGAFQRHDANQLATFAISDIHFIAPSVHTDGVDALERSYMSLFAKRPDVTLFHHENRIAVNEDWNLASEYGDLLERWTYPDGVKFVSDNVEARRRPLSRIQRGHSAGELLREFLLPAEMRYWGQRRY